YEEPTARGEGYFELRRDGKFAGRWHPDGAEGWADWDGERGFEGVWDTTFGPLRLVEEGGRALGFYEGLGSSDVDRVRAGTRRTFTSREPRARGEGWWELSDDGQGFTGLWRPEGGKLWQPWEGRRLRPTAGVTWLVVIEAHWQPHLLDREYSFGNMLKEFFARVPGVQFRHRFFNNADGLRHWCRDLMYLPEPVVAVVATHATTEGLTVRGEVVSPEVIVEGARYADNIKLLHFSSCLMLQEGPARTTTQGLLALNRFPISGYGTSVDWAASAILEFA